MRTYSSLGKRLFSCVNITCLYRTFMAFEFYEELILILIYVELDQKKFLVIDTNTCENMFFFICFYEGYY